ncbi:MAG TPA: VCBS repeat-containing protein [Gemmatimonadetes bacterium]|nr:VCBS repeat-containing protein [Gemmatimonadota bacterium]
MSNPNLAKTRSGGERYGMIRPLLVALLTTGLAVWPQPAQAQARAAVAGGALGAIGGVTLLPVVAADMDLDGDIDLVVGHVGAANSVFFNEGDGRRFRETSFGSAEGTTDRIAGRDVDDDGYPDLAEANSGGNNRVYPSRPTPYPS